MLVERQLQVVFTLSPKTDLAGNTLQETFAGTNGADQVTLSGLRMSAHIGKTGGASMGEMQLRVYGMSMSLMNRLSLIGHSPLELSRNRVTLLAGDANVGMSVVFLGDVTQAYTDLGNAPDAVFYVIAHAGAYEAGLKIAPTSRKGTVDAANIMQGLATQMGLIFENSGVSVQLSNPYLWGSARTQAQDCAEAANINWIIDNGVLAIWPMGGARDKKAIEVSPGTGMVGYPISGGNMRVALHTIFNPGIAFGAPVVVQSEITTACGTWTVMEIHHDLECQMPGGQWFTTIIGAPLGIVPFPD